MRKTIRRKNSWKMLSVLLLFILTCSSILATEVIDNALNQSKSFIQSVDGVDYGIPTYRTGDYNSSQFEVSYLTALGIIIGHNGLSIDYQDANIPEIIMHEYGHYLLFKNYFNYFQLFSIPEGMTAALKWKMRTI